LKEGSKMASAHGFTLLSGVVRNRKAMARPTEEIRTRTVSIEGKEYLDDDGALSGIYRLFQCFSLPLILRNFRMRVHKFTFRWDLVGYLCLCLITLVPFCFSGEAYFAILPVFIWILYSGLYLLGPRRASKLLSLQYFSKVEFTFTSSLEEFFSPKVMPVLCVSFILVVFSLAVTGRKLQGPPLCFNTCRMCLATWQSAISIDENSLTELTLNENDGFACGHSNGKELLTYYTMAQTSFILFFTVIFTMVLCMAWRVANEEQQDRAVAVQWLKKEDEEAYELRVKINQRHGPPGTFIRAEGNPTWVVSGVFGAIVFTLLGCRNWRAMPVQPTTSLLVALHVLTITASTLLLHIAFFGRLLAIYTRNRQRVQMLSELLRSEGVSAVDAWWNCRNFVLNEDLALDYDIGGLAVSAMFVVNVSIFVVVVSQLYHEGFATILEPPGNYCAFGVLYITLCLIRIFTLATTTYEEQYSHMNILQKMSFRLASMPASSSGTGLSTLMPGQTVPIQQMSMNVHQNHFLEYGNDTGGNTAAMGLGIDTFMSDGYDAMIGLDMDSPYDGSSSIDKGHIGMNFSGKSPRSLGSGCHNHSPSRDSDSSERLSFAEKGDINDCSGNKNNSSSGEGDKRSGPSQDESIDLGLGLFTRFFSASSNIISNNRDRDSDGETSSHSISSTKSISGERGVDKSVDLVGVSGTGPGDSGGLSVGVPLQRTPSLTLETRRQTLAEMISQISKYDPYPCILGIPVMPSLFKTARFYIYIGFTLMVCKVCMTLYHSYDSVLDTPAVQALGVKA
jgi:hypothetical protein